MPRHYVRKSTKGMGYTSEALHTAALAVKKGVMNLRCASLKFGIPRTTIHNWVQKYDDTFTIPATFHRTALPYKSEIRLVNVLKVLRDWGFRLTRQDITQLTAEFIRLNKFKNLRHFKNNTPGYEWQINFCKRHMLKVYTGNAQPGNPFIVSEYFTRLNTFLKDSNLQPRQIWNVTDTSMDVFASQTDVQAENVTVMTTVNAQGEKLAPFVAFRKQNVTEWMLLEGNSEQSPGINNKGRMATNILHTFLTKALIPSFENTSEPILVLYDGRNSLVGLNAVELAQRHNITIIKLPSQTSPRLQPLDTFFETVWEDEFVEWQRIYADEKFTKNVLFKVVSTIWNKITPELILEGFRTSGVHPFNSNVLPENEYNKKYYTEWQKSLADSALDPLTTSKQAQSNLSETVAENIVSQSETEIACEFLLREGTEYVVKNEPSEIVMQYEEEFLDEEYLD